MPNSKQAKQQVSLTEENPFQACTLLQRRYVEARLQGLNVSASEKAAGVKPGSKFERNPHVREAMRWVVQDSFSDVTNLGKNDVLRGMKDAVEAAATSTELVGAWREIGKLIGAYEPERKILEIHDYSADELKTLSEADLKKLAGDRVSGAIDGEFYEVDSGDR